MASNHLILPLFISCTFFISSLSARTTDFSSFRLGRNGNRMIKDLNLHPSHGANIFKSNARSFDDELKVSDSGLAEKRLSFPFKILGDSGASVSDLAQRAGYFRIQHTIDA
ncbi:hypothetical protein Tco_0768178, partial [Tanacetum coccineum]